MRVESLSHELAIELTPADVFLRLSLDDQPAFVFEQQENGNPSRYAQIFFDVYEKLTIHEGVLRAEGQSGSRQFVGNPLRNLERYLGRFRRRGPGSLPPFAGATVGYLGYDCVRYLERLNLSAQASGEEEAIFITFRRAVILDRQTGRAVLVHHLFSDDTGEARNRDRIRRELAKLASRLQSEQVRELLPRSAPGARGPSVISEPGFREAVAKIKAHIAAGDIFQCVMSRRKTFSLHAHPFSVYRNLREVNPSPYHFYFESGGQTLVGASPERLVKIDGNRMEACLIAGTRPRGATTGEDRRLNRQLRRSRKERAEHLMLVDLVRNDLGRVCRPGTVTVPEFMAIHYFSHVMHLVSRVEGKLKAEHSPLAALLACFPAGALTGAPKIRAMQILAELEPHRRGAYGGAVVLLDFEGQLDSCITIRTLVAREGRAYLQAGAGIVADSEPSREFFETEHKMQAMSAAVKLADSTRATVQKTKADEVTSRFRSPSLGEARR